MDLLFFFLSVPTFEKHAPYLGKCSRAGRDNRTDVTPLASCPQRGKSSRFRGRESLVSGTGREDFMRRGAWLGSGREGQMAKGDILSLRR